MSAMNSQGVGSEGKPIYLDPHGAAKETTPATSSDSPDTVGHFNDNKLVTKGYVDANLKATVESLSISNAADFSNAIPRVFSSPKLQSTTLKPANFSELITYDDSDFRLIITDISLDGDPGQNNGDQISLDVIIPEGLNGDTPVYVTSKDVTYQQNKKYWILERRAIGSQSKLGFYELVEGTDYQVGDAVGNDVPNAFGVYDPKIYDSEMYAHEIYRLGIARISTGSTETYIKVVEISNETLTGHADFPYSPKFDSKQTGEWFLSLIDSHVYSSGTIFKAGTKLRMSYIRGITTSTETTRAIDVKYLIVPYGNRRTS